MASFAVAESDGYFHRFVMLSHGFAPLFYRDSVPRLPPVWHRVKSAARQRARDWSGRIYAFSWSTHSPGLRILVVYAFSAALGKEISDAQDS
jgi:hypothetical protein